MTFLRIIISVLRRSLDIMLFRLFLLAITSLRWALICSVTSLPLSASLTVTVHLSLRFAPITAFNDTVGWIGDLTIAYFQCNISVVFLINSPR